MRWKPVAAIALVAYPAIVSAIGADIWWDRLLPIRIDDPIRVPKELLRGILLYAPACAAGAWLLFPESVPGGRRLGSASGVTLMATILEVEPTGLQIDNRPQFRLSVRLEASGNEEIREASLLVTPEDVPPRPGDRLPVRTAPGGIGLIPLSDQ